MDREYYKSLCLTVLENDMYYEKQQAHEPKEVLQELSTIIDKYGQTLTTKEKAYLLSFNAKTSNFYGLPKIHKSQIIGDACKIAGSSYISVESPADLKIRPIVAGPTCETHKISNLLDILLKPYITKVQSYVRDTVDLLNTIPEKINPESILVSFDVTNLYSNIPHELGLTAIEWWQKLGTAMGTKVAPTYATLVLGFLEEKLFVTLEETFGQHFGNYIRMSWRRYLDDCFIIWDRGEDQLAEFFNILNSMSPTLKFTMESDRSRLSFLDVMIIKNGDRITTDVFYKITDTKQYLMFDSCHPRHIRNNIPYNLARRLCTIISDAEILDTRLKELQVLLLQRHYPRKLILNGITKALSLDRKELLTVKTQNLKNVIPYVSTHNPQNPEIYNVIRNNLPILEEDPDMKKILDNSQVIKSKRQSPNLKKILTRAFFSSQTQEVPTVKRCNKPRCGTCPYIAGGSDFHFKNGSKFTIKTSMSCTSSNLIYVIICAGCGENYIGQTGDTLRHRMTVHRQQIREPKYQCTLVSEHIRNCAVNKNPNFTIIPFYKFKCETTEQERETKEKLFIHKYKPVLNAGHA
uniref:Uncharacterized protein LOC111107980 n=2 Tax=Crassostrea virginica TaxID=6565 RepID=A0A8B8B7T4_CRAVI|nr:uncharacterized protein LOC111107980 [Crassostrea virginica]